MRIVTVEPTVFFVRAGAGLRRIVRVSLVNDGRPKAVWMRWPGGEGALSAGPAHERAQRARCVRAGRARNMPTSDVRAAGVVRSEVAVEWEPERWEVYIVHVPATIWASRTFPPTSCLTTRGSWRRRGPLL